MNAHTSINAHSWHQPCSFKIYPCPLISISTFDPPKDRAVATIQFTNDRDVENRPTYDFATMDVERLLTLSEASRVTGLAAGTLRRHRDEGRLQVQPRIPGTRSIWVSVQQLLDAGYKLVEDLPPVTVTGHGDTTELRRLRQQVDLQGQRLEEHAKRIEELMNENAKLREAKAHAEGALEVAERVLTKLTSGRRPTDEDPAALRGTSPDP